MQDLHPGVSHFPLNCHMDDDMKLIQAEYGLTGFAIVVKLYQKIYGELGYYCEWNRDVGLLFAQMNGVGYNFVSEVVGACLRRGIFCKTLFDRFQILTSHGIQKRYLRIVSRRIGEKILPEYALVKCAQNRGDVDKNKENVCRNPENAYSEALYKENKITTTTTLDIARVRACEITSKVETYETPSGSEIFVYFKDTGVQDAPHQAELFEAYNAKRGWDCLPDWKAAANLWIARMDEH